MSKLKTGCFPGCVQRHERPDDLGPRPEKSGTSANRTTVALNTRAALNRTVPPQPPIGKPPVQSYHSKTETVLTIAHVSLVLFHLKFGAQAPVGKTSCSYHNADKMTGVLAPMVLACFGGYMRRGFDDVAEGLKAHAEAIHAETGTIG